MGSPISLLVTVLILLLRTTIGNGFNLSPAPNYTFKQPSLRTFIKQTRSSYFGYSVNLRKSGVLVGAPRAQSDVEYQRNVNETGGVFRCSFGPPTTADPCRPYYLDKQGNTNYEDYYTHHREIRSEKKDHQMLGATLGGLGADGDWFVACAPKTIGDLGETYLLHGVCYLTEGTTETAQARTLHKIKPLRMKSHQSYVRQQDKAYNFMFGEQGFSVHVSEDGREVLIGAPGVMNWRGTVIRYRQRGYQRDETGPPVWTNVFHEHDRGSSLTHESVVPNSLYSGLPPCSYLGYAVSSGHFLGTHKLLYVASAPQSRQQQGEVIIFDYTGNRTLREMVMTRYRSFVGQQFGEYFGYSLLTEDFNSDGLPDLAIGAPMHSHTREHDTGAVYVYLNGGEMAFELQVKLSSTYELSGRFGTSLAKIGDCNRDGYGDIAIGAPFEENGAVYIFLGSANGLQLKPSQRLTSPTSFNPLLPSPRSMFGHAISRGVDIDGNGYNDLAVGAPNEETVYVYRTYPIVRVEARINSTRRELPAEGGSLEIAVCWSTDFPALIPFSVILQYRVHVDVPMGRAVSSSVRAASDRPGSEGEVIIVGSEPVCEHRRITVGASPTTLHKPITIDVEYEMAARATPPKDGGAAAFCNHCAILDPNDFNRVHERIPFRTGCSTHTCVSDLKLVSIRWTDIGTPYVIGSTRVATMELEVENSGENAYLPQVNITVPVRLPLVKLLPECQLLPAIDNRQGVVCDLNNRLPIRSGSRVKYSLVFDMTQLEGSEQVLAVRAISLTSSKEQWPVDNEIEHTLPLERFSQIDILSKTTPQTVSLEQQRGVINMTHLVKVRNNGPSTLRDFILHLDVPLAYTSGSAAGAKRCQVINLKDVQVTSSYNDTPLEIDWIQPNGEAPFFKQTSSFFSQAELGGIPPAVLEDIPRDIATTTESSRKTIPHEEMIYTLEEYDDYQLDVARQKRSSLWVPPSRQSSFGSVQPNDLPPNRTVFFNCAHPGGAGVECLQLQARPAAFPPGYKPILLELQYKLDLDAIEACLREQEDIFVLQILSDLDKAPDTGTDGVRRETFSVARNSPHTLIYRNASRSTPVWIYVTSSFGGIFLLALISYTMYRRGFFERHLKEELVKLNRESISFNDLEPEQEHD